MDQDPMALTLIGVLVLMCGASAIIAQPFPTFGPLVTKESRRTLVWTESGSITAADVYDGRGGVYHLQFFTLEPASLFHPVLLHNDMVFYIQSGEGTVAYNTRENAETEEIDVAGGDVYRLEEGTTFYVQSHADATRGKLRIHAIFDTSDVSNPWGLSVAVYSSIGDLVRCFDEKVLQRGFGVSEETIRTIKSAPSPPSIVPYSAHGGVTQNNLKEGVVESLFGLRRPSDSINNGKKKKKQRTKNKAFNFFKAKPDVKNRNGWSTALTHKDLKALKGSNFALFMVNLMRGSMVAPHWNPKATDIVVVVSGLGMMQIVCPSDPSGKAIEGLECRNSMVKVKEGDVLVVPMFHPMTQISYDNDVLLFVGFSSVAKKNHPQFLAGKRSVLRMIDQGVLAASFGLGNVTVVEELLCSQQEWAMLPCSSCAEAMETKMAEERKKEREEEARRREEEAKGREEEAKRREEEEARKGEEEARRREEEEAKRREEEAARKEEEEEAKRREEEEAKRREEEEEARRREEEEAKRREEEAAQREAEEAKKREEEEAKGREEEAAPREEEEEARQREEEEAKRREEKEARRREEEEARREEEAAAREEEEEAKRREEEEAERTEEEEARRREEEEARRREEEEMESREEEEARRREEEEAERREEEEARRREEEAAAREEEEEARRGREEEEAKKTEEEEARRREEEESESRKEKETRREKEREETEEGRSKEKEEAGTGEEETESREEEGIRKKEEEGRGGEEEKAEGEETEEARRREKEEVRTEEEAKEDEQRRF